MRLDTLFAGPDRPSDVLLIANDDSTLPHSRAGIIAGVSQFLYRMRCSKAE